MTAKRYNPVVRNFCQRLASHGKTKMEVIGAAMRKLIHIVFGVLKTGKSFDEALAKLFPDLGATKSSTVAQPPENQPVQQETASQQPPPAQINEVDRLLKQASQLLTDYERLTAEVKHREAGDKLDQLKQTLTELNRRRSGA